jgi:type III secretory pathway lipoprotein EscJ
MWARLAAGLWAVAGCIACSVPVATGLDEPDANRAVASLERAGVSAQKQPDPAAEDRFRVLVGRDESSVAGVVLAQENLPSQTGLSRFESAEAEDAT